MLRFVVPSASPRPECPTFGAGFSFFNFYVAGVGCLRLHRLRAPRDALLHVGLDCFVLFRCLLGGALALGFHCWYGLFLAMVLFLGPVGLFWAVLCFGSLLHLRLVAVDGSWLHLLRRLRALYGDLLRDDLDYLALLGLCFTAPSRFPGVASPSSPSSWSLRCSTT